MGLLVTQGCVGWSQQRAVYRVVGRT
uniref:Uncharacterized protein n=1 Tax=Rhizophora mucronata TaxID=61149 RepID=A0A2P2R546_RHIMU